MDTDSDTEQLMDRLPELATESSIRTIEDIERFVDGLPDDVFRSDVESDTVTAAVGLCCEKCGASLAAKESLVCRHCGWYASIGSFVEIDKSWEVAADPELAVEADAAQAPAAKLPTWAWILAGSVVGVIVESLAVQLVIADGSAVRTTWSLAQLFVGFVAFAVCHTYCFVLAMKNEADINLMDFFLRPIKSWSIIFRDMPKRGWTCYVGFSGFTAATMSMLVIGGIPYERLLDWNVEKSAKSSLMGAIMSQAQNLATEEEQSMEEALGDFAGKAGLEDAKKKAKAAGKDREKQDCIIIGYMANQAGQVQTLLLAAEHYAKLTYAGRVRASDLSEDELHELTTNLAAIKTHKPFIRKSIYGATWVTPKYLCRVSYKRRDKQGGLYGTKVEDPLGEVDLSGK